MSARGVPDRSVTQGLLYKRFLAERRKACVRKACVPVTGARPVEANGSQRVRAVWQESGGRASPAKSAPTPVDLNIKRIKGVVEK